MKKLTCLLLAWAWCAAAQTVEGTVSNLATGGGIAGAAVMLQRANRVLYSAFTDEAGRFRIDGVKTGTYSVSYYADHYSHPGSPESRQRLQVTAATTTVRLDATLIPDGRISGMVIDGRGDAVPRARVELTLLPNELAAARLAALGWPFRMKALALREFWTLQTDAHGRFEFDSVRPGIFDYLLAIAPPPDWLPPSPEPASQQARGWARTYFPGVAFRERATPIVLPVGRAIWDVKIKLLALALHAVRGTLRLPDGTPAPNVSLALFEPGPRRNAAYHAVSTADGAFVFPAVVEGEWRLSADSGEQDGEFRAERWLTVDGRDLEGLEVRLSPPFTLRGRVVLQERAGLSDPYFPLPSMIRQHAGQLLLGSAEIPSVATDADGGFAFESLAPGDYAIDPGPAPSSFYLAAVRLGEAADAADPATPFQLSIAEPKIADLRIVYQSDGGTVHGTVERCEAARVVLAPDDRAGSQAFGGTCDEAGRFTIGGIRPGEYYALVVSSEQFLTIDAAMLQNARRVTVRAGEVSQIDLRRPAP